MTSDFSEIKPTLVTERKFHQGGKGIGDVLIHGSVYYVTVENVVHVYDCMSHTKQEEITISGGHIYDIKVSNDNQVLFVVALLSLHCINLDTKTEVVIKTASSILDLVEGDTDNVIVFTSNVALNIWNYKTGKHVQHIRSYNTNDYESTSLTYNANTKNILYSFGNVLYVQNLSWVNVNGLLPRESNFNAFSRYSCSMEWISDARFVVYKKDDGCLRLYDMEQGHIASTYIYSDGMCIRVSLCKRYICMPSKNGVSVFRADTLNTVHDFLFDGVTVGIHRKLCFSDDGNMMYISNMQEMKGFNIQYAFESPLMTSHNFALYANQGKVKHCTNGTSTYQLFFNITCATRVVVGSVHTLMLLNGDMSSLMMLMTPDAHEWAEAICATAAHHRRLGEDNTTKAAGCAIVCAYRTDILQYIRRYSNIRVSKDVMELIVAYTLC